MDHYVLNNKKQLMLMKTCDPKGTISSQSYGGIICVPCGFGKCFAKDTEILFIRWIY